MDKQSCPLIFGSCKLYMKQNHLFIDKILFSDVYPIDQLIYIWDTERAPVLYGEELSLSQFDLLTTPYRDGTINFTRGI